MRFLSLRPEGAYLVELEPLEDERGAFARSFCRDEFAAHGLATSFVQHNVSRNLRAGTLRGLHYQCAPHGEAKLLRCVRGSAHAVVLDLRRATPTFGRWAAVQIDAAGGAALYVPEGCACGFQTLEDDTELHYQMSAPHHPPSARGIRWDDPAFAIEWPPASPRILSANDASWPAWGQGSEPHA